MGVSLDFVDELIQVEEVAIDEFLHLAHVEPKPASITRHQVVTQGEGLRLQELDVIDFVLFDNEVSLLHLRPVVLLDHFHVRRQELLDLGRDVQLDFVGRVGFRVELQPDQVVEEGPLMRMELCDLHK